MLEIIETLEEWIQPFKDFIMENHSNPILWVGIILLVLAVFGVVSKALDKD